MMTEVEVGAELATLKDFQRRTVEHVFRRLYTDADQVRRFLVADEVGLGKTMVARGVIAKTIHHLQQTVPNIRVDVVYVCSNAAIASQNIRRLNVHGQEDATMATRLTMLPLRMASLRKNKVNFVSFTPATTFDLRSRGGTKEERALLFRLLERDTGASAMALRNMLQAKVGVDNWQRCIDECPHAAIDPELAAQFRSRLLGSSLHEQLRVVLDAFARRKENVPREHSDLRYEVIGALRQELASTCIDALEPDLIILDEFQRFRDLMHGEDDTASLAQQLFAYGSARLLLLSATPYRMLSMAHEQDEDHHRDFLETVRFLAHGAQLSVEQLAAALSEMRRALLDAHGDQRQRIAASRAVIEDMLRLVMCRTERVASTRKRDAMIRERKLTATLTTADVEQAVAADRLSNLLEADDPIEYWKSAPYLLSFMEGYELKERVRDCEAVDDELRAALHANERFMLTREQVAAYAPIEMQHPRMRELARDTLEANSWRLLWLPPSVPYIAPSGPYAELGEGATTKSLVFSAWRVVPKALAVLLSYEAERRMIGAHTEGVQYENAGRKFRRRLVYSLKNKQPQGMTALALLYPCSTLAQNVDPLELALRRDEEGLAGIDVFRKTFTAKVEPLIQRLVAKFGAATTGAVDQRWYWAVPVLLDANQPAVLSWIDSSAGLRGLFSEEEENAADSDDEDDDARDGFERHVDALLEVVRGKEKLGRVPEDLGEVIADFALASPAVCAVRAIRRVSRLSNTSDEHVLTAAARVARGFQTLFNVPESIALLRGDDESKPYWRRVLDYCVDGNLQAVLDEYAHLLVSSEGVTAKPGEVIAEKVANAMLRALSPRTVTPSVDEVRLHGDKISIEPFRVRCRYALRFGEMDDEQGSAVERSKVTRDAFNSPFRPFVLASTSVGQEGLDFHSYAHVIYHWNLPTNPVDLEQREGRVNRYKGHAIRRNIGRDLGLAALRRFWDGVGDPWECLFEQAAAKRPPGANELSPYWLYETEGGVHIERRVPLLPLSREVAQLERLRRQLAVYRLAFGQPRQEDLLAYLSNREMSPEEVDESRIRLEPGSYEQEL